MVIACLLTDFKPPSDRFASPFLGSSPFPKPHRPASSRVGIDAKTWNNQGRLVHRRAGIVCGWLLPVDPWAPNIDSQSIATQLFAASLFPYIGFLYFITKSKSAPKLTLFGFYFLLIFVGATIPAGIYEAKVKYGTSLANVDWLHGGVESLLTLTNLFIVLGLRKALRKADDAKASLPRSESAVKEQKRSSSSV